MGLTATRWTDTDTGNYIEVAHTKPSGWHVFAVRNGAGSCLNKDGEWEYEPMPSNRDEKFIFRCRFDSFSDAAKALGKAGE